MSVVSHPPVSNLRMRRRVSVVRIASAGMVAVALGGLVAVGPLQDRSADAAVASAAPVTVAWQGDGSIASSYQPPRDSSSPHYNDFDTLEVTVAQTSGLIDQTVRVSVSGFAGTISSSVLTGVLADNAKNFVQAMQCWGPDPDAADFNETCQWGGRYGVGANGLGDSVYPDVSARVGPLDLTELSTYDVPFRTVDGQTISGKATVVNNQTVYPIQSIIGPSTTNEVTSARIGADGTGYFDFEMQSAIQAPQLGCGNSGQLRCWLVVVPRGTHFSELGGEQCSGVPNPLNGLELYTPGQENAIQGGSPVNPKCDYWENRVVIPLDFSPTRATCPIGSAETRVVGSQLMIGAMTSWQPSLCQKTDATFSFATNPDSVAREQLIDTRANTPDIVYASFPVSSGELDEEERQTFSKTKLSYAPVAVSAVVVAFYAESYAGRQEQLVLSPRLMAKLLTQSYGFLVPTTSSSSELSASHLGAINRSYTYFTQDPEFRELNPLTYSTFTANPAIVLPGPSGADALRQMWRWIFADADAVAFMNGAIDPWGMTVNPYYLPRGSPAANVPWYYDANGDYSATQPRRQVGLTNLDGTPKKLTEQPLDDIQKYDETIVPFSLGGGITSRFGSVQFAPFAETLLSSARQAFRADPLSRSRWDGSAPGDPLPGAWVNSGAQLPGSKFMIAITDSVSANRYGLSTAAVRLPNSTVLAKPDVANMTSALEALQATSLDSVKQVNPAAVVRGGYPMTIVTYAGVNLTKSTAAERKTIASMLTQVTTTGQESGSGIGQLPAGYVPLTPALKAQATVGISEISNYVPPSTASGNYAQDDYESGGNFSTGGGSVTGVTDPEVTAGVDELSTNRTLASTTEPITRSSLAIALIIGLCGFLIAPILFRGRGFL